MKEKLAKQEQRTEVIANIQSHAVPSEQSQLFRSSSTVGQSHETTKLHIKRLLLEKQAGISVTPDDGRSLFREVDVDDTEMPAYEPEKEDEEK